MLGGMVLFAVVILAWDLLTTRQQRRRQNR
jgi:hypothetical protein